jgi:N,N'-diacetyllegionaminate synthase
MKTIIIAEAGVNHNGDINLAKRLIDVAKECGADLVKFQLYDSNNLATKDAAKAEYQVLVTDSSESQREMLSKLELTEDMMKELILYAKSKGIDIFATGFDIKSVNTLINLGQDRFKIPSGEITNLPLLRHVGRLNKQIIISTGMCELNEVAYALETLITSGTPKEKITILHCTSAYPAPVSDINLNAMQAMQKIFESEI